MPNPQAAIPLPPRPDLEQYRKLAKDLVKACKSGDPDAIFEWAADWVASLARALGREVSQRNRDRADGKAAEIEELAVRTLKSGARSCVLADAQFVLARCHGFESWPKLVAYIDALAHTSSETAAFEAAADAIVAGDEAALERLLATNPALIHARSAREHRATLLHYVSANGVEGYRQRTPKNAVAIAKILLDAGAEVDAESPVYRGKCTTLGLVATSVHPFAAGVQNPLMQILLDHGARIEHPDMAGNGHSAVLACLANGRGEAAEYLAERGARLGLVEAAGVGRLDVVKSFFDEQNKPKPGVTKHDIQEAFLYAVGWGQDDVVRYLIDKGVALDEPRGGQTALHWAGMGAQLDMIHLLIAHGAPLEAHNEYGGTVLGQTLWSAAHGGDPDEFVPVIETLIAAGAKLDSRHPPINEKVDAVLARYGSVSDPERYWFGEGPRTKKAP